MRENNVDNKLLVISPDHNVPTYLSANEWDLLLRGEATCPFCACWGCHAEAKQLTLHQAWSGAEVRRFVVRIVTHMDTATATS